MPNIVKHNFSTASESKVAVKIQLFLHAGVTEANWDLVEVAFRLLDIVVSLSYYYFFFAADGAFPIHLGSPTTNNKISR